MPKQCYEKIQKICQCQDNVAEKYRIFVSVDTSTEDVSVPRQGNEIVQKICQRRDNVTKKYTWFISAETTKKYRFVSAEKL